ncbi:MAG: putative sensor domain DACNV-containing protein [Deltaproteobacteria bacterium]
MSRRYAYPADLAHYVQEHWPEGRSLPLSGELLDEALAVCFQASLTPEEGRTTRFRLLLTSPSELPEAGTPNEGVLRLDFSQDRPLSANELRRLSPATPFESSLIGAHAVEGALRIWGIAHSGPAWLAPTYGGRSPVPNWTYDPIVHVTGPGHVAVRRAGKLIGSLERGLLVDETLDVFDSEWLPALFRREREEVRAEHAARQASRPVPSFADSALVGRISQQMLRRAIQLVRGAQHGGMLLVVDANPGGVSPSGLRGLRLKFPFEGNEPARRYRSLLFQILQRVADASSAESVGWTDFVHDQSPDIERLEQAVFELSRLIAGLAAIDGAVVLDKRFQILGFGAEVSAELPSPERVWHALDTEGAHCEAAAVEDVGTRHRAAYRFVRDNPNGLAIVISHDGGVSFVANRAGEAVFWEQSLSP